MRWEARPAHSRRPSHPLSRRQVRSDLTSKRMMARMESARERRRRSPLPHGTTDRLQQTGIGSGNPGNGRVIQVITTTGTTNTVPDDERRWHSLVQYGTAFQTLAQPRPNSDVAQPSWEISPFEGR